MAFNKKSLGERLKDTGFLLKHSFSIVGKNSGIVAPTIRMAVLTTIIITSVFLSLLSFFTGLYAGWGTLLLLFTIFVLLPYRIFYEVRQKAAQSWMVYEALRGNTMTYKEALAHVKEQRGSLRMIAFVDLLIKWATSSRGERKGIMGVLITIFFSALQEIWDLLSHYLYPAVVIEGKPLRELVPKIKDLRNNVPATLVGVFGIDFAGTVVSTLLFPLYLLFLVVGVGIGYLLAPFMESTVWTFAGLSFSWVPVLFMIYLIALIGGILKRLVDSVKVIYFTLFYTAITRPMDIKAISQEEVTHYLRMDASSAGNSQLESYIRQYFDQGYTPEQLKDFLVSQGYAAADVVAAIKAVQKSR